MYAAAGSEIISLDMPAEFLYYFLKGLRLSKQKGETYVKREAAEDVHGYQETVS